MLRPVRVFRVVRLFRRSARLHGPLLAILSPLSPSLMLVHVTQRKGSEPALAAFDVAAWGVMWCGAACLQVHVAQPHRHSARRSPHARVERHDAPHHHHLRLRRARYKSVHARLSPACVHVASIPLLFLPLETCCLLLRHIRTYHESQPVPCPREQLCSATITPNSSAISGLRCVGVVAGGGGGQV